LSAYRLARALYTCEHTLWIDNGQTLMDGPTEDSIFYQVW